jgi:D-3-phosphoglycerate dehydrogenase / 2-oxoglutarate reductase
MANKYKVYGFAKMKPGSMEAEMSEFKKAGLDVEAVELKYNGEDDFIKKVKDADAVMGGHMFNRRVVEALPKCQVVVTYSVGYDGIDVQAATDNGLIICNNPAQEWCVEEVSNQAVTLILACAKKLVLQDTLVKQGKWMDAKKALSPMGGIHDETLGLVGCGAIARLVAKKAQVFKMKLIGFDPYLDKSLAAESGITLMDLPEVLKKSDYISVHTPLSESTRHLLSEKEFRLMKPTAYVINTARGPVIDEAALVKALKEKWIAGAGLDVFEQEPTDPNNPLLKMPNVIAIPHSASYSDAAIETQQYNPAREVARVLKGYWPKNVVNRGVKPKKPLKKEG